ncbi:MAG: hypothetical protein WEE89_00155 [Gemmatimonadota bacterium]
MKQDERFEEFVRTAAKEMDPVGEIPRAEMWTRIAEARRFQRTRTARKFPAFATWGVGLAAALAIGIGLGRWSALDRTPENGVAAVSTPQPSPANMEDAASDMTASYRFAALQHLGSVEVLLTSVSSGAVDPQLKSWARNMLTNTRYLLDSPAGADPRMASLLEDLELILAQIASANPNVNQAELDLIQDGIKHTAVLPRLRATQSANSNVAGT